MADNKKSYFESDEDEKKEELNLYRKDKPVRPDEIKRAAAELAEGGNEKIKELMDRIEPLFEQIQSLYNQYFAGIENAPPTERRKQLESMIQTLTLAPKTTPAIQFRYNTIFNTHLSYKERWDKKMKDLDDGKIRRMKG